MALKYDQLTGNLKKLIDKAIADEDRVAGGGLPVAKPTKSNPLEPKAQNRQMVDLGVGELLIRITRRCSRKYDGDNLQGGCKQLRDAIAATFGFTGDSEEDGLVFEYEQIKGEQGLTIEVYEKCPTKQKPNWFGKTSS